MAGLVLKLAPKERVLINGAVLENDVRRSRFSIITPSANVLRLKDAIHPDQAQTPISRLCYLLQLVIAGSASFSDVSGQIKTQLRNLSGIFKEGFFGEQIQAADRALEEQKFYSALKCLKVLLPLEEQLLSKNRVAG